MPHLTPIHSLLTNRCIPESCLEDRASRFKTVGERAVAFVTKEEQSHDAATWTVIFEGDQQRWQHGFLTGWHHQAQVFRRFSMINSILGVKVFVEILMWFRPWCRLHQSLDIDRLTSQFLCGFRHHSQRLSLHKKRSNSWCFLSTTSNVKKGSVSGSVSSDATQSATVGIDAPLCVWSLQHRFCRICIPWWELQSTRTIFCTQNISFFVVCYKIKSLIVW